MKVAIMQPYFFPYIGYWQLMEKVDRWIIFDDIQFINKGWINRNRILHPNEKKEWQYITIPLSKKKQKDKICEILIDNNKSWFEEINGKLTHYANKAPFYNYTINLFKHCVVKKETNLSDLLVKTVYELANALNIKAEIQLQSELKIELENIEHAGQWALRICEIVGAKEYVNPVSGQKLFNHDEYRSSGIELKFFYGEEENYNQKRDSFVPKLSILDSLMWQGIDKLKSDIKLGLIK
jgi:hypothetical protein